MLFPSWASLSMIKIAGMNCSNAFRTGVDAALSDGAQGDEGSAETVKELLAKGGKSGT